MPNLTSAQGREVKTFTTTENRKLFAGRLPRVCVVTGELVGPFKNGGLGTSMTGLVELLGAHGADVTVLYTGDVVGDVGIWKMRYANAGIRLEILSESNPAALVGPLATIGWTNAWLLFEALKQRNFEVIHFNDTVGEGAFCFVAKSLGLAFHKTLLVLALHSPTEWILESNGNVANWAGFCCFTAAERLSIANADLLWGPSRFLLNWIVERDYRLPANVYNQQYVIPTDDLFGAGRDKIKRAAAETTPLPIRRPREIVFFGRLEERKGIRLFVSAITRLGPELKRRNVSVLFMGKPSSVNGEPADEFIRSRSVEWPFEWRIESGLGQREAVAYLREQDCVAVMASPVDNSPCTVYEALQFGIPFIAARTGGIPELIHADDQPRHLFDYRIDALCERLLAVLDQGIAIARPAISVAENQQRWLSMHRAWQSYLPIEGKQPIPARWGVLVDHFASGPELAATIASIRAELGPDVAPVILRREIAAIPDALRATCLIVDELVDDTPAEIIAKLDQTGAGAILMVRAGVRLRPGTRDTLEKAAAGAADAYVPAVAIAELDATMPSLGASAALSFLEGDYDSGMVVLDAKRLAARLGPGFERLDRSRHFLGVIEALHASDGEVWPLPVAIAEVNSAAGVVVKPLSEARRTLAYASTRHRERYQMLGIGRHAYRHTFPATLPAQPSVLMQLVTVAVKRTGLANNLRAKDFIRRHVVRLGGSRALNLLLVLRRWTRAN